MSVRIIVYGALGHMGRLVTEAVEKDPDLTLAARVDRSGLDGTFPSIHDFPGEADCVIDFSHHDGTRLLLDDCVSRKLPLVLCTTSQTPEELDLIQQASGQIPLFQSANMSVGVALVARLVEEAASKFRGSDIEVLEIHHNRKLDAPSGTALMLAEAAKKARPGAEILTGRSGHHKREPQEIGVASLRMGNIVGTHEVFLGTNTQTITIKHEALDRALFADGAVDAAKFLVNKPAGRYDMNDLLSE